MSDLIKALQILLKYGDPKRPTHCEHDVMLISDVDPAEVSTADIAELEVLGVTHGVHEQGGGGDCFYSYRFGKA